MQSNETAKVAHKGCVSRKEQDRQEAIAELRKYMKPGTTVLTIPSRVSFWGISPLIDVHVIVDNEPLRFTWTTAKSSGLDLRPQARGTQSVPAADLDAGFDTVYRLSGLLHGDGYALKQWWF